MEKQTDKQTVAKSLPGRLLLAWVKRLQILHKVWSVVKVAWDAGGRGCRPPISNIW